MAAFIDISELLAASAPSTAFRYSVLPTTINPHGVPLSGHRCRRKVRYWFQLLFIISSIIFLAAIFPSLDSRKNPRFIVESAVVFPFDVDHSASELNASWYFTLIVRNPNRHITIHYDEIQAAVLYGFETSRIPREMRYLAAKSLPPFVQEHNRVTYLRFRLDAVDKFLGTAGADQLLLKREYGSVEFELRLIARSRYMVDETEIGERTLRVSCSPVGLGFQPGAEFGDMDMNSSCKVFKSVLKK